MQEQSRMCLTAALGFVASGTVNAATSEQANAPLCENSSLMAVDTSDGYRAQLASKGKKTKNGQSKGKEGSCKGKEGSCKGDDQGGQLPGVGTGSGY